MTSPSLTIMVSGSVMNWGLAITTVSSGWPNNGPNQHHGHCHYNQHYQKGKPKINQDTKWQHLHLLQLTCCVLPIVVILVIEGVFLLIWRPCRCNLNLASLVFVKDVLLYFALWQILPSNNCMFAFHLLPAWSPLYNCGHHLFSSLLFCRDTTQLFSSSFSVDQVQNCKNIRKEKSAGCPHIIVIFRFMYIVWAWIQLFELFEESQRWRKPNLIFDKSLRVIEPENCAMSSFLCRKLFHRTDFKVQL